MSLMPPLRTAMSWLLLAACLAVPSLPARMNADSLDMYGQALTGVYHDWHSPLVPLIWRALGVNDSSYTHSAYVIAAFTIFVTFVVFSSFALVLRSGRMSWRASTIGALLLCLFPPVLGFLVAAVKDTWVAAALLALVASHAVEARAPAWRLWGLRAVLAAFAAVVRMEVVLLFPVIAAAEGLIRPPLWRRQVVLSLVGAVALTAVGQWATLKLAEPLERHAGQQILTYDLAGLSLRTGQMLLPPEVFPSQDMAVLQRFYSPVTIIPLYWGEPPEGPARIIDDPKVLTGLRSRLVSAILAHPRAYISVKNARFREYWRGFAPYHPGIDQNCCIALWFPSLHAAVDAVLEVAKGTRLGGHGLFIGGFAALFIAAAASGLHRARRDILPMLAMAGAYQLAFWAFAPAADFRYAYAGVLIVSVYGVLIGHHLWASLLEPVQRRLKGRRALSHESPTPSPAPSPAGTALPHQLFLSLVIVVRDQAGEVEGCLRDAAAVLGRLCSDYEIIVVDNGSQDDTVATLRQLAHVKQMANLQVFGLTKEVDIDVASWVGIENALGDYVVVVDPMAEDVGFVEQMIDAALQGSAVVFARNLSTRPQGVVYRLGALLVERLSGIDVSRELPGYRLMSRQVVNFMGQHAAPALMYRWLPATAGFAKANLTYQAVPRRSRRRSLMDSIDRAMRLLVTSANTPMRLVTSLSLFGAVANVVYSLYVIAVALVKHDVAPGWVTLSLQQSGMFFLLSLVLLVIGEYILHMASLSNDGPRYHVAEEFTSMVLTRQQRLNVEEAQASADRPAPVPHA